MHRRICKTLFTFLCVALLWVNGVNADDKTLSLVLVDSFGTGVSSIFEGDPVLVEVRVNNADLVAGASFTVTYNPAKLALRNQNPVTSSFFETFVQQGLLTDPAYVTVPGDSNQYYSPLVANPVSNGVMIAAARFDNGEGVDVPIVTLHFEFIGSSGDCSNPGDCPISITPSIISNTDAGYAASGEAISELVGIDGDSYPVHDVTNVDLSVVIPAFVDFDNDGIDDNWEYDQIPINTPSGEELNVFKANRDYDHDGYSDYQEYLNRNELDPADNSYDPIIANAPDGTGYGTLKRATPAINFLLLGK